MKNAELCYTKRGENMTELLIQLTEQTIEEFQETALFKDVKMSQTIFQDVIIQDLLKTYQSAQDKYHDVKKYGHHHPDYKTVQKSYQEAKIKLYTHPLMIEYLESTKAFQKILDQFTQALAQTISAQIQLGHIPR